MSWNRWILQWVPFWNVPNNFFNSDEALLDDKQRPRDQYWFRLQPWRQSEKSSLNTTEYLKIYWWIEANKWQFYQIPFAFNNIGKLNLTQTYRYSAEQYEKWMASVKIWKTSWAVKNKHLVIPKTWLYVINYSVRFAFPSWASFSADPKCMASIDKVENWVYDWLDVVQWHLLFVDYAKFWNTIVEYLKWWTELVLYWYISTTSNYKCLFRWCIEIMQVA